MKNTLRVALLCLPSFLLFNPHLVLAQDALDEMEEIFNLEEIVVTARKRFEVMQDIPISMIAVTGEAIKDQNILKMEDLTVAIPSVHVSEAALGNLLFVRGVGSGLNQGFEQTVGTFIDGLYYGKGALSRYPFFDLERVEVLKGPQGILFGKNTVAGALSITTADPSADFMAEMIGLYEAEHAEHNVTGVISGPLAEDWRARLSFRLSGREGWIENTNKDEDEPGSDEQAVRIALAWDPSENMELVMKLSTAEIDVEGRTTELASCSPNLLAAFNTENFINLNQDCELDDKKNDGGSFVESLDGNSGFDFDQDFVDTRIDTFAFTADWDNNEASITYVLGYLAYDLEEANDGDFGPLPFIMGERDEQFDQFSQELRVSSTLGESFEYLVGLYWQKSEFKADFNAHVNADGDFITHMALLDTVGRVRGSRNNYFEQDSETVALFSQIVWYIQDTLRATLGLRYSEEAKDVQKKQVISQLGATEATDNVVISGLFGQFLLSFDHEIKDSRDESNLSPSLNIEWDVTDDIMVYTSFARGFKGGGFDGIYGGGPTIVDGKEVLEGFEFEEENVTSYEMGSKMRLAEGAASLSVALFLSNFDDVQVSAFNGAFDVTVTNAGETQVQGFEIDGRWRLLEGLVVGGAYGYLDAEYKDYPNAQCIANQTAAQGCIGHDDDGIEDHQDLAGQTTQFAPENSFSLNAEYDYWLSDSLLTVAFLEIVYSDEYFINVDLDPATKQDAYTKVNLRLSLSHEEQQWDVALLMKNLTDEETSTNGADVPLFAGSTVLNLDRPRSYALQVRYAF